MPKTPQGNKLPLAQPRKKKPSLNNELDLTHSATPAQISIDYKSQLSKYLSPYAQITECKDTAAIPNYIKNPPCTQPHVKFVPYGTGTGKSYSAMNEYTCFQSMDYPDLDSSAIYQRQQSQSNFTNAVFVTPNKNQINFSEDLVAKMLSKGIVPLSALGLSDMYNHSTRLWVGGVYSIEERLWDYIATITLISKAAKAEKVSGWRRYHVETLAKLIHKLTDAVSRIKEIENQYNVKTLSLEEYDKEKLIAVNIHNQTVQHLVKASLNNLFNIKTAYFNNAMTTVRERDSEDNFEVEATARIFESNIDVDDDTLALTTAESGDEEIEGSQGMHPIEEEDVYDVIFLPAKEKPHFDDLLSSVLNIKEDSFECMLATLKKDIMRVYAPLNFAVYLPSFISMTSDKFRMRASMYRKSKAKGEGVKQWTLAVDFDSYAGLLGNKHDFKGALSSIPSTTTDARKKQVDYLNATLMLPRLDSRSVGGNDDRTQFAKNNISFYIIVDEANGLFEREFIGNKFKRGVIKPIMDNFSITDLMSCVVRKYREYRTQPKELIDCYRQNEYFFAAMYAYLDKYCEIDAEKVLSKKAGGTNQQDDWLLQFDFPPNILYIDNAESFSITDIVKNAFSVTAKQFIDKEKLESIFFCSRGQHRYLSSKRSSDSDITLYELYQIIIATVFAAIRFEDTEIKSPFTAEERQAFKLDLGGGAVNSKVKRQNEPFAALLTFAKGHAVQYRNWLEGSHLRNEPDALIDDWFTYIQTKLLFTLNRNKTFDSSPDLGHGQKTFFDIKLHLITHHPELDILRAVVGTQNHLHLMSATSGKTNAYSGQYNINFIREWGDDLGVTVTLPEYDHYHNRDYREVFRGFRAHRAKMRTIEVITYESALDIKSMLNEPKSPVYGRMGRRAPLDHENLKEKLITVHESTNNDYLGIAKGSFNDTALSNAFAGLFLSLQKPDSTLHISYRSDLFKLLLASMKSEFAYKHANRDRLAHAIKDKQASVTFNHSIFGEFQLPLLNSFLAHQKQKSGTVNISRVTYDVIEKYIYMPDFYDLENIMAAWAGKVARLALYDSSIDKLVPNYRANFIADKVKHKGEDREIYTSIVSYNKAAALGLNNVVDNKITGLIEDVNRLFISSLAWWSDINSKASSDNDDMDGFSKVENSLVYMRYCAAHSDDKPILISEFDANLTTAAAATLLRHEHSLQKNNNFKQTLGRTEREDSRAGFESEIILPLEDLKEQTKVSYISYQLDKDGLPNCDTTDYAFMSLNNQTALDHGLKIITASATTDEKRKRLEVDTRRTQSSIERFVAFDGFMGKIIQAARLGDTGDDAKELADAAIEFDRAYREPSILLSPKTWLQTLASTNMISNPEIAERLGWDADEVMALLNSIYINPNDYANGDSLDLYQLTIGVRTVGLTDFFGRHNNSIESYEPSKFVLKNIDKTKLAEDDTQFISLVDFNNKLTNPKQGLYHTDPKNPMVLHPAMMHMALGNLGERLFEQFLKIYTGGYVAFDVIDIVDKFGYRLYEFFDFWLKSTKTGSWICVDVKNFSHKENVQQTQRLHASADRKADVIEADYDTTEQDEIDTALERLPAMSEFFSDSNEIHLVFVNVREGEYSKTRHIKRNINIKGSDITVNIYYLCLFQRVLYLDESKRKLLVTEKNDFGGKRKPASRKLHLTINPKLIEILGIEKQYGVGQSFHQTGISNNEDDYDMTDAVASIFSDTEDGDDYNQTNDNK